MASEDAQKQCWACRKKRVICDFGRPGCEKCKKAGVECPGYATQKPLQWLAPGRVTSKEKKRKKVKKEEDGNVDSVQALPLVVASGSSISARLDLEMTVIVGQPKVEPSYADTNPFINWINISPEIERGRLSAQALVNVKDEPGQHDEQEEAIWNIPTAAFRDETTEVVQATFYYNKNMWPALLSYYEMAPSPYVIQVPLSALHQLPPIIRYSMVSLALGYRAHRQDITGAVAWPKIYHHRGKAIRTLNDTISKCKVGPGKGNMTRKQQEELNWLIRCVVVFLSADIQYCAGMEWRHHIDAMARLLSVRGGLKSLWHEAPLIRSAIVHFTLIQVFASSTSPVDDKIDTRPYEMVLDLPEEMYERMISYYLCPPALFRNITEINLLRVRVAHGAVDAATAEATALDILLRIETFSTPNWAVSQQAFPEDFGLIAMIYHSAVMLYCNLSLQRILQSTPRLRALHAMYGDLLVSSLVRALSQNNPRMRYFLAWPMAVMGVEAANSGPGKQAWIEEELTTTSKRVGTCSTLMVRSCLKKFWKGGGRSWDECFCRDYAFHC
ncbi:fungal-specific transcription factor domain-containing protein [Lophiotrema nucula]|uniref:Fungal-specific transcription factor domain-containing protein n=1 Tax=Lophiotrema nucula TaxID=690887 RepID=A0A6A5YT70_9PLEO|nr:fungal-specific transcription factor domain-containing protein [Lophiotrema nucula]